MLADMPPNMPPAGTFLPLILSGWGTNRRCDCDGYSPDTLGDEIGGWSNLVSGAFKLATRCGKDLGCAMR